MSASQLEYEHMTQLINRCQSGHRSSADELYEMVHSHLKTIARQQRKGANHLDATEMVNILYLRLSKNKDFEYQNRQHFFRTAALAARQIIIDEARRKLARPETIRDPMELDASTKPLHLMLEVENALKKLEASDTESARVFELKYFVGMTDNEVADALSLTNRTVQRKWQQAKQRLQKELPGPAK